MTNKFQIRHFGSIIIRSLLCVVFMFSYSGFLRAHSAPSGSPLANREHPRIWLSAATIPEIRAKIAGSMLSDYQTFITYMDSVYDSSRGIDIQSTSDRNRLYRIKNYAFIYALGPVPGITYGHTPAQYAAKAKDLMLASVTAANWPPYQDGGDQRTVSVALGYDWLYSQFTPSERSQVANWLKQVQYDDSKKSLFHQYRTQTRYWSAIAGLAYAYDPLDDGSGDQRLNLYNGSVVGNGGSLDAANLYAGNSGGWSSGMLYSVNQTGEGDLISHLMVLEAWRTANNISKEATFGGTNATAARYYPQWVSYMTLPQRSVKGWAIMQKMMETHAPPDDYVGFGDQYIALAGLQHFKGVDDDMASLAQWISINTDNVLGSSGEAADRGALMKFIFGQPGITPKSPAQLGLPLTKNFEPMGWVCMKSGWDLDAGNTMVTFWASRWARPGYMGVESNAFTIDRKGPLALHSGSEGHQWYGNATYAANTMLFPDPNENNPPQNLEKWDQGGQKYNVFPDLETPRTSWTPGSPWDIGGIKRIQIVDETPNHDYDYIYSDATRAYNGPRSLDTVGNTSKVALFTRQLIFIRPDTPSGPSRVVVYDRTETTNTKFEKRWQLHTAYNPIIDGSETSVRAGKWSYSGAGKVIAAVTTDGLNGKLFSQTLLPLSRKLIKIGGPGHEYEDPYGEVIHQHEATDSVYTGDYRVEVIPAVPSLYDTFLHTLEATDANVVSATPSALLDGTNIYGARFGNWITAFHKQEEYLATGNFTVDTAGNYKILICDLIPNAAYTITIGGSPSNKTASAAGTIYMQSAVGAGNQVSVNTSATVPPTISNLSASPSQIGSGASAMLNWETKNATSVTIDQGIGAVSATGTKSVNPTSTKIYTLTASNGSASATQTVTVTVGGVTSNNQAPIVSAGADQTVTLPGSGTLSGTASDDGLPTSSQLTTSWSRVSGPGVVVFGSPASLGTTATFSQAGIYVVRLTASDGSLSSIDDVTITVNGAAQTNLPPTVNVGSDQSITLPASASLAGQAADDRLPNPPGALTYAWTKVSGPGSVSFGNGSSASTTASFSQDGTYVLQLSVSDSLLSANDSLTVVVSPAGSGGGNQAPAVNAGADQAVTMPTAVNLTGVALDDGLPSPPGTLSYSWAKVSGPGTVSFGNGSSASTTATFSQAGTYVLRLSATDSVLTANDTVSFTVSQPPAPIALMSAGPPVISVSGQPVTLSWITINATSVSIDKGVGSVGPIGSWVVNPTGTTVYTLTATGPGGTVTAQTGVILQTLTGAGGLPTPILTLPSHLPVNGNLTAAYPVEYSGISYQWTINPATIGSTNSFSAKSSPSGAPLATFSTLTNYANLASYALAPGYYLVTVQANNGSSLSGLASANVTLVSADLDQVRVFPNPWRSDRHATRSITFENLTVNTEIKIFTVSGHHVKTLPISNQSVDWDLKTEGGDQVASGVYLYVLKAEDGSKKTGKVVIIK